MRTDELVFWVQDFVLHLIGGAAVFLANHVPFAGHVVARSAEFFANDLLISGVLPFAIVATAAAGIGPTRSVFRADAQ